MVSLRGANQNFYFELGKDPDEQSTNKVKKRRNNTYDEQYPQLKITKQQKNNEPKFITITTTDKNKTLNTYNPFVVKKGVEAISKEFTNASFLRDGSLLLLCKSAAIAERFIRHKKLANIEVDIQLHQKLNSSKGTVYNRQLISLSEKDILEGLKEQGVIEVVKLTRTRDGQTTATGLAILTFDSYTIPQEVDIGFEVAEVKEYIPNPMRCRKCQTLGHTTKRCTNEDELCPDCAEIVPHAEKCSKLYCVNCKVETHASKDSKCPKFLLEKEFLKIKTQRRCTMYEAKKFYYAKNPGVTQNKPSFADMARPRATENIQKQPTKQTFITTAANNANKITTIAPVEQNQSTTATKQTITAIIHEQPDITKQNTDNIDATNNDKPKPKRQINTSRKQSVTIQPATPQNLEQIIETTEITKPQNHKQNNIETAQTNPPQIQEQYTITNTPPRQRTENRIFNSHPNTPIGAANIGMDNVLHVSDPNLHIVPNPRLMEVTSDEESV